ncbi:MAG TPA: hypothetical protein VEK57_23525 [Thermoanaerobaculia bacterium]|nr:hypothetical protein [Thermoanaerobaculia bacterium]
MTRLRALLAVLLFASTAGAQLTVRYRTENTIYINAGSAAGVAVGDRFEVLRGGNVIATIEVQFAAEQSASARIVTESAAIAAGDTVRRIGAPVTTQPPPPPALPGLGGRGRGFASTSLSGNVSLDHEANQRDYGRTLARVSARARHIAGLPLTFRTRLRLASETDENRNRLYELSLLYEPFDGRVAVQAGRLGNSPAIGLGYLDGALVRVRIIDGLDAGAFYGFRPDVTELTPDTSTTKYGAFVRVEPVPMAELTIAGVQIEKDSDKSSFIAVDGRYAPSERLSLFAHGRAAISGDADEERGVDTILTAVGRITASTTLSASYERIQPGIDDDLRTTDEIIEDGLRQGFRVTLRHPNFFLGGGVRTGDDDPIATNDDGGDNTYSAAAGVSHPSLLFGIGASLSATAFSSPLNDGVFANTRFARRFGAGHLAELTAGALLVDEPAAEDFTMTTWIRGGVWVELPYDVFARAELELTGGDAPPGHRINLGVGYRF